MIVDAQKLESLAAIVQRSIADVFEFSTALDQNCQFVRHWGSPFSRGRCQDTHGSLHQRLVGVVRKLRRSLGLQPVISPSSTARSFLKTSAISKI